MIAGARVKSLRSHLAAADLEQLARDGAAPASPPPLPATQNETGAVEVDRSVSSSGNVSLAGRPARRRARSPAGPCYAAPWASLRVSLSQRCCDFSASITGADNPQLTHRLLANRREKDVAVPFVAAGRGKGAG
jgi:hypothetical protein